MATVRTISGASYVIMRPEEIAKLARDGGPVFRHMVVQGEKVKQEAIRIAPRSKTYPGSRNTPGNLANHIVKRIVSQGGQPYVLVGIDTSVVKYAIFVHEGAPPHMIWPKDREKGRLVFYSQKLGKVIYMPVGKPVHHPGNQPNRFLVRAMDALKS